MSPAAYLAILVVAYLYGFWVVFIVVMGVYRASLAGRLVGVTKALAYPIVVVGVALDLTCQYTLATALFFDLPVRGEYMVTFRLQRYVKDDDGWRGDVALYICQHLLDVFDPSGNHCK